jgi:hypothetical protein
LFRYIMMSVPMSVLVELYVLNRGSERSIGRKRICERVGPAPDAQEEKETNERGNATGKVTGKLVALTGTQSWPFARGCNAFLTVQQYNKYPTFVVGYDQQGNTHR